AIALLYSQFHCLSFHLNYLIYVLFYLFHCPNPLRIHSKYLLQFFPLSHCFLALHALMFSMLFLSFMYSTSSFNEKNGALCTLISFFFINTIPLLFLFFSIY